MESQLSPTSSTLESTARPQPASPATAPVQSIVNAPEQQAIAKDLTGELDFDQDRDFIITQFQQALKTLDHETAREIIQNYGKIAEEQHDRDFSLLLARAKKSFTQYGFKSEYQLLLDSTPSNNTERIINIYQALLKFEPENQQWKSELKRLSSVKPATTDSTQGAHVDVQKAEKTAAAIRAIQRDNRFNVTGTHVLMLMLAGCNTFFMSFMLLGALNVTTVTINSPTSLILAYLVNALTFAASLPSVRLKFYEKKKIMFPNSVYVVFFVACFLFFFFSI